MTGGDQVAIATVVVSDLQGSTALTERLDPESMRAALDQYFSMLGRVMGEHGGRVEKRIGDMMVTVFDDGAALEALQAVHAAAAALVELNRELDRRWGVRLVNRTGIATGAVTSQAATGVHRVLGGTAFDTAMALEPIAPALGALVDAETVQAAGDAASFTELHTVTDRAGEAHRVAELVEAVRSDTTPLRDVGSPSTADADPTDAPRASRRHVTVVFIDLQVRADDDEAARRELLEVFEIARAALESHGGIVEKFIGDTVMAVFGLERRREDDARRAAAAALSVQHQLAQRTSGEAQVEVRIGVNTGPVVAGDPNAGERLVTGDAVNVAARLEQTAWPGAVVIGELTHRLVGTDADTVPLEPLELKGKSERVPAWRLLALERSTRRAAPSIELPFVGRDQELAALRAAWVEVGERGTWQRLDLVGAAGTGKSRLLHEWLDATSSVRVLRGSCPSYGEGLSFWPVVELLHEAAGTSRADDAATTLAALERISPDARTADLLAGLLGVHDRPAPLTELFWAVRRTLVHLAASAPLVVVIDALHLAQPTLHDLLDELLAGQEPAPVLLLTMSRTEPADGEVADTRSVVHTEPLDQRATEELISFATGHGALPSTLRDRLVQASEGVPLFVEQLLRQLIDDGRLRRTEQGWQPVGRVDDWQVPPSVEAVLSARVDALDAPERAVVDTAAVIGREFAARAVADLCSLGSIDDELVELDRRQLVAAAPSPDRLSDRRFTSPMTRDVAYTSLLKRSRAELHLQYADWLVDQEWLGQADDLLGYHLERCFALTAQIGVVDEPTVQVGRRAASHLGASARLAFARGDMPAAANLFGRAATVLPDDPVTAAELWVLGGEASFEEGRFDEALDRYTTAATRADDARAAGWAARAHLAQATQRYLTGDGDGAEADQAMQSAARAVEVLAPLGDHAGVARAWRLRSYVELTAGRWGDAEQSATLTLAEARAAGDTVLEHRMLPALSSFALYGPTPADEAVERCASLLEQVGDDQRARCLIERSLAHLLAMQGHVERAVQLCAPTRDRLAELGWNFDAALVSLDLGPIHLLGDDPASAEQVLRRDVQALREMGEQNYRATLTSMLADAVRLTGDAAAASALVDEAEQLSDDDDVSAAVGWRSVRARLAIDAGDAAAAIELLEVAATLLAPTDELTSQGEVLLDMAIARWHLGERSAALDAVASARQRFSDKGHAVGVRRCDRVRSSWG